MSIHQKGMVCVLHEWEVYDNEVNGAKPDCRNHRHLSLRRAFESTGDAQFANAILAYIVYPPRKPVGFIVEIGGTARWCAKSGQVKCREKISLARINRLLAVFQSAIERGDRRCYVMPLSRKDDI
jgi:hypothetical protein